MDCGSHRSLKMRRAVSATRLSLDIGTTINGKEWG